MDTSMTTQPTLERRRRGHPGVPEIDRRNIKVSINLNLAEAEQLSLRAEDAGMQCASYIRVAALGNSISAVPAINREAYIELARLAGNLNQLMRHINSDASCIVDGQQFGTSLQNLRSEVQALRSSLLGG